MKIAVTYDNGQVFQHFGHTEKFKLYYVENNEIISDCVIETNGSGHGALVDFLKTLDVNVVICGGIGGGAKIALANAGIELFGGVVGDADMVAKAYLNGTLAFNPVIECSHHNSGEHSCSGHSCQGSCGH